MATDQGIIEGKASELLRYRNMLGADINIFADVLVKHAYPLVSQSIGRAAKDTAYRGLADALIVTGSETGEQPSLQDLKAVKKAVPDRFLFAGSGVTTENVESVLEYADGCIVGKVFKRQQKMENPVDREMVTSFMEKVGELR
jgi:membrane complex biogenesis BtpA family protein